MHNIPIWKMFEQFLERELLREKSEEKPAPQNTAVLGELGLVIQNPLSSFLSLIQFSDGLEEVYKQFQDNSIFKK